MNTLLQRMKNLTREEIFILVVVLVCVILFIWLIIDFFTTPSKIEEPASQPQTPVPPSAPDYVEYPPPSEAPPTPSGGVSIVPSDFVRPTGGVSITGGGAAPPSVVMPSGGRSSGKGIPRPPIRSDLSIKDRWVAAHNFYRRMHCAPDVTWDTNAENLAKQWSQILISRNDFNHPSGGERSKYLPNMGQNLASFWSSQSGASNKPPEDVVADWYEEVIFPNVVGFDSRRSLAQQQQLIEQTVKQQRGGDCPGIEYIYGKDSCNPGSWYGHFTQVVWKGTNKIGCGEASGPNQGGVQHISTCNYLPPGNYAGRYTQNVLPKNCK